MPNLTDLVWSGTWAPPATRWCGRLPAGSQTVSRARTPTPTPHCACELKRPKGCHSRDGRPSAPRLPGDLPHHVAGVLVLPEALEARGPQVAGPRPLSKLELRDEPRLDEMGASLGPAGVERGVGTRQAFQHPAQSAQHRLGEPGSHLSCIHEAVAGVVADQDGTRQPPAPPLPFDPAADHELLPEAVLHLQPGAAATAGLVPAVEALRHHALEAVLQARLHRRGPVTHLLWRRLPVGTLQAERPELAPPGRVRLADKEPAVEVDDVEDHVHDRHGPHLLADLRRRRQAHPPLQLLEARPTPLVQGDDLAVQDRLAIVERARQRLELGVAGGDVLAVAGLEPDARALDERDGADPVPLELEAELVVRLGEAAGQDREHRLQLHRHLPPGRPVSGRHDIYDRRIRALRSPIRSSAALGPGGAGPRNAPAARGSASF